MNYQVYVLGGVNTLAKHQMNLDNINVSTRDNPNKINIINNRIISSLRDSNYNGILLDDVIGIIKQGIVIDSFKFSNKDIVIYPQMVLDSISTSLRDTNTKIALINDNLMTVARPSIMVNSFEVTSIKDIIVKSQMVLNSIKISARDNNYSSEIIDSINLLSRPSIMVDGYMKTSTRNSPNLPFMIVNNFKFSNKDIVVKPQMVLDSIKFAGGFKILDSISRSDTYMLSPKILNSMNIALRNNPNKLSMTINNLITSTEDTNYNSLLLDKIIIGTRWGGRIDGINYMENKFSPPKEAILLYQSIAETKEQLIVFATWY